MVDILNKSCKIDGGDNGVGLGTFNIKNISAELLEFTAALIIPVYTTDCPAP